MRLQFKGLWRHPDFLKLWAGQTISLFGSQITALALPLTAVLTLQATPAQMGMLRATHKHGVMRELFALAYLFLPLLIGLALHGFCIKYDILAFLCRPIDRGGKFHGKRIFGDNKTWRGVVVVSLGTAIGFGLQSLLLHGIASIRDIELFDYAFFKSVALGLGVGVAAMLSELPNSFIKRRFEIAPGSAAGGLKGVIFYVYDQVDFLLGAWMVLAIVVPVTVERALVSSVLLLVAHQLMSSVGHALGMRRTAR